MFYFSSTVFKHWEEWEDEQSISDLCDSQCRQFSHIFFPRPHPIPSEVQSTAVAKLRQTPPARAFAWSTDFGNDYFNLLFRGTLARVGAEKLARVMTQTQKKRDHILYSAISAEFHQNVSVTFKEGSELVKVFLFFLIQNRHDC